MSMATILGRHSGDDRYEHGFIDPTSTLMTPKSFSTTFNFLLCSRQLFPSA